MGCMDAVEGVITVGQAIFAVIVGLVLAFIAGFLGELVFGLPSAVPFGLVMLFHVGIAVHLLVDEFLL